MNNGDEKSISEIFTTIYLENRWGDGIQIPKSGVGSLPSNAVQYVRFIEKIITDYKIESVVDVGHGDWSMWRDYKFENVRYFGVDVSRGLSEQVSSQYGNPNRIFKFADGIHSELPSSDLLICKDVLQHLPNGQIIEFLEMCKRYRYIVLSNDIVDYSLVNIYRIIVARVDFFGRAAHIRRLKNPLYKTYRFGNNYEIEPGSGRGLDLQKKPFLGVLSNFKVICTFDYFVGNRGITINRVHFLTSINHERPLA
jgi:hypothetical protein